MSAASLAFHSRSARRATVRDCLRGLPGDARRGETGPIVGERGTRARLTGRVGVEGPCSLAAVVFARMAAGFSSIPKTVCAVCAVRRVDLIGRAGPTEWPSEAARPSELLWLVETVSLSGGEASFEGVSSSLVASSSASSADDVRTGGARAVGVARSPRERNDILRTRPRARRGCDWGTTGAAVIDALSLAARW